MQNPFFTTLRPSASAERNMGTFAFTLTWLWIAALNVVTWSALAGGVTFAIHWAWQT